jgi:hypothetical protein
MISYQYQLNINMNIVRIVRAGWFRTKSKSLSDAGTVQSWNG